VEIIQHRTTKHSPGREPITPWYLVLHDTEGYMPGTLGWLADTPSPPATASAHYLVTRAGDIYQLGYDRWSMWHAGRTYWVDRAPGVKPDTSGNADMIGIELEHVTEDQGREYPAAQLRALDELIAHIFDANPTLKGVVGHKEIAYPRGRKADPQLDVLDYQIGAVRLRLGQLEGDDMFTDQDRALLQAVAKKLDRSFVSDVARSYDWAMERADDAGDTAEVSRLQTEKGVEIAKLKKELGLE